MATRLYLHNTAHGLSGTVPTGEQSGSTATLTATNANSLLKMDSNLGASQTSRTLTTNASTTAQSAFLGFWTSLPLSGAQSIGGVSESVTVNIARAESNTNSNFEINICCYVWRPSTGANVGNLIDGVADATATIAENTSAATEQVGSGGRSLADGPVSAANGDVVIVEIWRRSVAQAMATAYTNTIYWDGTTANTTANATVSNHASFVEFTQNLTFQAPLTNPTLSADPGSYSVTGAAATMVRTRVLTADSGSYSVNGAAATTSKGYVVSADSGAYSLTGVDVTDVIARGMNAAAGSYSLSGTAATIGAQRNIVAGPGSYLLTGADVISVRGYALVADAGSYAVTGNAATLAHGYVLLADPGSYSLTGVDATLVYVPLVGAYELNAEPGVYSVTGSGATLLRDYLLNAGPGSYAVVGQDATLVYTAANVVVAEVPNLSFGIGPMGKTRVHPHPLFSRVKQ